MKTYDLIAIRIDSSSNIQITSTDEKVVEWIAEQSKEMSPAVEVNKPSSKFPHIDNLSRRFSKMDYQPYQLCLWLIQQLCQSGWEPFGNIEIDANWAFPSATLRRTQENLA